MTEGGADSIDFRLIAEQTRDWESWISPDGRPRWVNDAVERITGCPAAQCLGMPDYPLALVDARDRDALRGLLADAAAGGHGHDEPVRIRRQDGSLTWVAVSWYGVRSARGEHLGTRLSIRDQADSRMVRHHMRYHAAISGLSRGGLLALDDTARAFQAITEAAARALDVARVGIWLMSADRERIECRDLFDLSAGEHRSGAVVERGRYPGYFAALDQDRVIAAEHAARDARTRELADDYLAEQGIGALLDAPIVLCGRTVGVLCHEQIGPGRHWSAGEVNFASALADLVAMVMEAAERRDLGRRQQHLASILEASPDFVGTSDILGRPTYINPAGRSLVGLAPDEPLEGWDVADLYTPWAREQRDRVSIPTALRQGVWAGESEFLTRYREPFPVFQVVIAHKDGQGRLQYLSTVARDLRPWKAAQAELQERERFLTTLVANLPGVVYRRRNAPDWPMEYMSEGCLELTGYHAADILAARPYYNDIVHPDDRAAVYAEVDAALAEGRPFEVVYRVVRADGRVIWVWSKGRGIHDEAGRLVAREGFIGDITERVLAQQALERLNAELEARVAERTARLDETNQQLQAFAYSVSHDLKAPLRGIDGYSRLLLEDYRDQLPEEGQGFLANIRAASERMNQLIDDLLAYSRLERRELNPARVPLASIIERVLAERRIEIDSRGVRVRAQVDGLSVQADADALAQSLRNLVDNAIKFSANAHPPWVELGARAEGGRVILSVADNGCGFDMKYHDRIFNIFQRLHRLEDYPGTGVGLAIVRKAMERMGGRVWAESQPGAGATFYLELPQ